MKATKTHIKKARSRKTISKVIKKKGIKSGKLPRGKELHHIKPVAEGGSTTTKNTRIVTKAKHKRIHANRKKRGLI